MIVGDVRLVIWDLDEVFWHGTLTEGGMSYRQDVHDIVVTLARRGIISSICSKNNPADVQKVLTKAGIWEYFVFPSINWQPKGPRLAAQVAAMQLRAPNVLFIDDNALNRAEAAHFVPGLQVADDKVIDSLLGHLALQGKPDAAMTRLAQYRLLQARHADAASSPGDTADFLRASGIRVSIEHDLGPHIARAVELINRTNQLNFTKSRLPEDGAAAAAQLRELLSRYAIQAGIIHVQDKYGDYGYCGLYVVRSYREHHELLHFCFSCRILNMGVETWLYDRLGRPKLKIKGEVLSNVIADTRLIDWIALTLPNARTGARNKDTLFDAIYARGACDIQAIMHYFDLLSASMECEFVTTRHGTALPLAHTLFVHYAVNGIDQAAINAFVPLGYAAEDFTSPATSWPKGQGFWLLSFFCEAQYPLWRHRATGALIPFRAMHALKPGETESACDASRRHYLAQNFDVIGKIGEAAFKQNLTTLLQLAPDGTKIFVLLMNEVRVEPNARGDMIERAWCDLNTWTRQVTSERPNVELLPMADFAQSAAEIRAGNHFDRMVYFRIHRHILARCAPPEENLPA